MLKRKFFLPSSHNGSTNWSGLTQYSLGESLPMAQKPELPYANLIKLLEDGTLGLLENSSSDRDFCEELESISDVVKQTLRMANTTALRLPTQELTYSRVAARDITDAIERLNASYNGRGVDLLSEVKKQLDTYIQAREADPKKNLRER